MRVWSSFSPERTVRTTLSVKRRPDLENTAIEPKCLRPTPSSQKHRFHPVNLHTTTFAFTICHAFYPRSISHPGHPDGPTHSIHDIRAVTTCDIRSEANTNACCESLAQSERSCGEIGVREGTVGDGGSARCEDVEFRR